MVAATGSATAPQTTSTSAADVSRTRLAENFNTFLTLLTTQMKNQDPLSPMDSTQFTQQIVQMTGVEQQLQTNDLLKQLVSNTASGISAAVSLIGKDVRVVSDNAALSNGEAKWIYDLDRAADDVKIEILNDKGTVVDVRAPSDNKAGEHAFTWDGKGANGSKLPDGTYTLRITAKDSSGTAVPTTTYVQGTVTGVEQADGQTLLTINGGKVDWSKVTSIAQPAAAVANTNTASGANAGSGSATNNPDDESSSVAAA